MFNWNKLNFPVEVVIGCKVKYKQRIFWEFLSLDTEIDTKKTIRKRMFMS